jgi:CRP-like cAMP-binding protein
MTGVLSNPISALDLPAPGWLKEAPEVSADWAKLLVAASLHGRIETYARGTEIETSPNDLLLVLKGCVLCIAPAQHDDGHHIFISALRKGDIITPSIFSRVRIGLHARSTITALRVSHTVIPEYMSNPGVLEKLFFAMELELTRVFAEAATATLLRDQAKILRVIEILASHPEAICTTAGMEIEASKDEIRSLAGVHRRSATRAFHALVESGVVSFNGYKRVYLSGTAT